MSKRPHKLSDFLSLNNVQEEQTYLSDQKYRSLRAKKGMYSRQNDCFDFIYLIQSWKDVVGQMLAQNTIPLKIQFGTLYIVTRHSIFSHELSFMTQIIIEKVENVFPKLKGHIKKIKFINSEKFFMKDEKKKSLEKAPEEKKLHVFSPQYQKAKAQAQELFADIEDEELKEIFTSLYIQNE